MQIVKCDRNNQLVKDEATRFRKNESPRKYGTKVKKDPQSRASLRWGGVVGKIMAIGTMGVPARSHATPSQKNRLGKRGRLKIRCPGPARRQNTNEEEYDDDHHHVGMTCAV